MNDLFLIAHKVRGERAFDIAIQMEVGPEVWWIIPTTGHRAYPYWWVAFNQIDFEMFRISGHELPEMPEELRDFYAASDVFKKKRKTAREESREILDNLNLEELGL